MKPLQTNPSQFGKPSLGMSLVALLLVSLSVGELPAVFGQGALIDFRDRPSRPHIVNAGQALHSYRVTSLTVDAVLEARLPKYRFLRNSKIPLIEPSRLASCSRFLKMWQLNVSP